MADDRAREAPPGITQADSLYRGFPDFSAWGELPSVDLDLWNRFAASLEERRKAATPEALKAAVDVAVRAAALDTGAIEGLYSVDRGFTMTVAIQGLAWEQMVEERGSDVRELFQAQLEAYEFVLDAVTGDRPITEVWIRTLHETLCAPQKTYRVLTEVGWQEQELHKGEYKTRPNHVRLSDGTFHAYAPVDRVSAEMHRLLQQIRTPEFEAAHPVLQASYVHYAFVVIHPFADGNGRVARALASTFFYRAQSIPLVIFANQRPAYLDALHAADLGDHRPLFGFFRDRGIDTMQLIVEGLMTVEASKPEDVAAQIRQVVSERGLSAIEVDNIAGRILTAIHDQMRSQKEALGPLGFSLQARPARLGNHVDFELRSPLVPAATGLGASVSFSPDAHFPFLVQASQSDDALEIRLEDVFPELTPSLQFRLERWVQRRLVEMLRDLEGKAGLEENLP